MSGPAFGDRESGFTLVEMMIALLIFAILGSGAVMLLRFSVDAEAVSRERVDEMAEMRRFTAIWNADLAQAVPRTSRAADGALQPAFAAGETAGRDALVTLTRGGWTNYDRAARPSLQKVEYRLTDGALERIGYPMLDGAQPTDASVVLTGVESVALRFRLAQGQWSDIWQPQLATELPITVDLTIQRTGEAPLRLVALTGANYQ